MTSSIMIIFSHRPFHIGGSLERIESLPLAVFEILDSKHEFDLSGSRDVIDLIRENWQNHLNPYRPFPILVLWNQASISF